MTQMAKIYNIEWFNHAYETFLYLCLTKLTLTQIKDLWQKKVFIHDLPISIFNEGISAPSFCCQAAAWVTNMFCNIYLVKNHKIANNSTTTKLQKKYAQIWNP